MKVVSLLEAAFVQVTSCLFMASNPILFSGARGVGRIPSYGVPVRIWFKLIRCLCLIHGYILGKVPGVPVRIWFILICLFMFKAWIDIGQSTRGASKDMVYIDLFVYV